MRFLPFLFTGLMGCGLLVTAGGAGYPARANAPTEWTTEDPLLGVVRALKCVNCVRDSVVFLVDDPIDGQVIEVKIPSREYNKVLTSLQGKRLFNKPDSGCFYWREKVKPAAKDTTQKQAVKKTTSQPVSDAKAAQAAALPADSAVYKVGPCLPYSAQYKGIH